MSVEEIDEHDAVGPSAPPEDDVHPATSPPDAQHPDAAVAARRRPVPIWLVVATLAVAAASGVAVFLSSWMMAGIQESLKGPFFGAYVPHAFDLPSVLVGMPLLSSRMFAPAAMGFIAAGVAVVAVALAMLLPVRGSRLVSLWLWIVIGWTAYWITVWVMGYLIGAPRF